MTYVDYTEETYDVMRIYLLFDKTFDKVPHQRLLNKVRDNGMGM